MIRVVVAVGAVLAVDWSTKLLLFTLPPFQHHRSFTHAWTGILLGVALILCAIRVSGWSPGWFQPIVLPTALLGAGVLSNAADAADGVVSNPFVRHLGPHSYEGFNFADLTVTVTRWWAAAAAVWCLTLLLVGVILDRRVRRGTLA